jgi:hypothetical protein
LPWPRFLPAACEGKGGKAWWLVGSRCRRPRFVKVPRGRCTASRYDVRSRLRRGCTPAQCARRGPGRLQCTR